jgi:Xaa-Pro aminopeptidase
MFQSFEITARPEAAPPRVAALRDWLLAEGLDAFLVPRADAHGGEYVAPCDERLAWITGFTGSAGFAVIARDRAAVFTDGRYTLQVRAQTDPDTFETVRWPATKLADWLSGAFPDGARLGFDPWLHPVREMDGLANLPGIELVPAPNGVDAVWTDRPDRPRGAVMAYPDDLAGRTSEAKRAEIAEALREARARAAVVTQPDAICWLLNIRGTDLARSPLVLAFAILHDDGRVALFSDPGKFHGLDLGPAVALHGWDAFGDALAALEGPVLIDPDAAPRAVADALGERALHGADPIALPKARKTAAEIAATRSAHLRDGAAMARFLRWLDEDRPADATETTVVAALERFRCDTDALRDISFETIAGSGPNGAIVHYRVNEETDRPLAGDPAILVDSGGQYLDGTTDVTRTVPLVAPPPDDLRHAFTRVLQGMIAVSRARFPVGVAGAHLDALARAPLWAEHRDYDHGTGHGVGVYLGVHEGPARISRVSQVPLEEGMILSNEPGYYRAGEWGIRIENLVVVIRPERPECGDDREMLGFETLTQVPIDRRMIDARLLSPDERAWVDSYHRGVAERIGPLLDARDRAWLEKMCAPL